jgi:ribosomal protein S18 acetylase RimI-like enzyme
MTDFKIARAALTDLDALVDLFEAYRAFYGCAPRDAESRQFLEQRLARGDSRILIARDTAGLAAGFVQLYPCFSSLSIAAVWILNDLYVKPEYRAAGVGRALMDAARHMGEETGAARLLLVTAPDNAPARRLYESLGYVAESPMIHYALDLSRPTR